MKKTTSVVLALMGLVAMMSTLQVVEAQQWKQLTAQNPPAARMDHDVSVMFDKTLVLFAGWSGSGLFLNDTWTLDVSPLLSGSGSSSWSQVNAKLLPANMTRADHTLSILQPNSNPILMSFAGGRFPSDTRTNDILTLSSNLQWNDLSVQQTLPPPRMGHSTVIVNADTPSTSFLVAFGGSTNLGTVNDLWSFDIASSQWTQHKPSSTKELWPIARLWHTMVAVNDTTGILFGGDSTESGPVLGDIWALNWQTWTWTKIEPQGSTKPSARSGHVSVALNGNVYIFGGQGVLGSTISNQLWKFSLATNSWTLIGNTDPQPSPRLGSKGAIIQNNLVIFSGCTANSPQAGCTAFDNQLWTIPLA
eukprot:TRINITY_DN3677_c0_g1_i1.p1 TRINITY_DN3677_c0_g1~~TRINITY_DN3677_c0_g1_i1.p1  ORF type:complete len:370 (-),score=160.16 TRINITY_DN3677_c0_g1_i1:25-1110(-)